MCAPVSEEQMAAWRAERARKLGMAKIKDAQLFGTAHIERITMSFESHSYERRFLQFVAQRKERERVAA